MFCIALQKSRLSSFNMGNILIFGGTFDPPHKGHRHLLNAALKMQEFDRVLLIPAFIPPHKSHHPSLSFEMREAVLADYFGDIDGLEVLDVEARRGGKSYTVDTIEEIKTLFPEDNLHLLIGTDMFRSFESWFCFEKLLEEVVLIVGSREIGDRAELEALKHQFEKQYSCKGILLCDMKPLVCASSDLRAEGGGLAERALAHISSNLDLQRARHTMQVAEYARLLAERNGVSAEKAYLAGLLHDCTKCCSQDWHLQYAKDNGVFLSEDDLACPQVLHQITGRIFAENELGCDDPEILAAIGCHTTGKVGMSRLELLIFFADSCEPSRNYPDVEAIRRVGEVDLEKGSLMLFEHIIAFLINNNAHLHPQSLAARDALKKELENNG